MESVTWAQLGIHDKRCGILNVDGFFDDLLGFVAPRGRPRVHQGAPGRRVGHRRRRRRPAVSARGRDERSGRSPVGHDARLPQTGGAVAYRLSYNNHKEALDLARRHPELLDNAVTAGYLTCQPGDDGHPASIQLTPDVAYSLGLTTTAETPVHARTASAPGDQISRMNAAGLHGRPADAQ